MAVTVITDLGPCDCCGCPCISCPDSGDIPRTVYATFNEAACGQLSGTYALSQTGECDGEWFYEVVGTDGFLYWLIFRCLDTANLSFTVSKQTTTGGGLVWTFDDTNNVGVDGYSCDPLSAEFGPFLGTIGSPDGDCPNRATTLRVTVTE